MRPTVVNNVETLTAVPDIIKMGGEAYQKLGTEKSGGTKLWSVSGHVNSPGVYELPMGYDDMEKFIMEDCGGILDGKQLKAVIPGGSSGTSCAPIRLSGKTCAWITKDLWPRVRVLAQVVSS